MLNADFQKKKTLVSALERGNKWWKGGFELEFKPREIYEEIKKFMGTKQIISLTGLRRVGKTVIMLKLAQEYAAKFGRENIVYFSFDDFRDTSVRGVIGAYSELMSKDMEQGRYLFLLDEIQKVEGWEEQLKREYDLNPHLKFVISGSESLFIRKKSRESLAGRMYEFHVKALNFREYLQFRGKKFDNLLLYEEEIVREFHHFLLCNGFPELVQEEEEIIEKYIKENIIEKIIYKDIPLLIPIKEPEVLGQILRIILNDPGEIINLNELAGELGISRQTASLYLDYLEKSFLIRKLYNFSRNARKTERKSKKYYPTIILPELAKRNEFFGRVFETFMVLQLEAEFFWRDTRKNEVDAVLVANKVISPIEIKSSKIDYGPLKLFMKKFKLDRGMVISYNKKEHLEFNGKSIEVIPFYEYLLGGK